MAIKLYGKIQSSQKEWVLTGLPPHVCIQLKALFPSIPVYESKVFRIEKIDKLTFDLDWFLIRYPMEMTPIVRKEITTKTREYRKKLNSLESIYLKSYKPKVVQLKAPFKARKYQLVAKDLNYAQKKILIADEFGLGKTLTSILLLLEKETLPAIVVCETHLQQQWKEQIEKFTNLVVHKVKGTRPYELPKADVFIVKYSCVAGWVDVLSLPDFKTAIFDECQSLRHPGSNRYQASKTICLSKEYVSFLSATPIYNYGVEIFYILHCMKKGCLGNAQDFFREWGMKVVRDPNALGSYLRDEFLMIRRTRKDVRKELPPINKIVYTVDYDDSEVENEMELIRKLAYTVVNSNNYIEKGSAARDLDLRLRQMTGVAKATSCAAFVKMLTDNGEKVVVGAWHRTVYDKMQNFFNNHGIKWCMYTGSETASEKEKSKKSFIEGDAQVLFMSLRSGAGTDGLQQVCSYVVIAEFDWSPKVHDQFIARVDRPGNESQTTAVFLTCDFGSDPVMIDLLGLKSSQSQGVIDPFSNPADQHSDHSRITALANKILETEKPVTQTV